MTHPYHQTYCINWQQLCCMKSWFLVLLKYSTKLIVVAVVELVVVVVKTSCFSQCGSPTLPADCLCWLSVPRAWISDELHGLRHIFAAGCVFPIHEITRGRLQSGDDHVESARSRHLQNCNFTQAPFYCERFSLPHLSIRIDQSLDYVLRWMRLLHTSAWTQCECCHHVAVILSSSDETLWQWTSYQISFVGGFVIMA